MRPRRRAACSTHLPSTSQVHDSNVIPFYCSIEQSLRHKPVAMPHRGRLATPQSPCNATPQLPCPLLVVVGGRLIVHQLHEAKAQLRGVVTAKCVPGKADLHPHLHHLQGAPEDTAQQVAVAEVAVPAEGGPRGGR